MKKLGSILCALVLAFCCVLLVGCGAKGNASPKDMTGNAYVGTWKAVHAEAFGQEMPVDEAMGGELILVLNADGTASLTGADSVSEGTWTESNGTVKTSGSDFNLELKDKDGLLETSVIGVHIQFEKQ